MSHDNYSLVPEYTIIFRDGIICRTFAKGDELKGKEYR